MAKKDVPLVVQKGVGRSAKILLRIRKTWPLLVLGVSQYQGMLLMLEHMRYDYLGSFSETVGKDGRLNYHADPKGEWHISLKKGADADPAYGVILDTAGGQHFATKAQGAILEMTMIKDQRLKLWARRGELGRANVECLKKLALENLVTEEVA